MRSSTFSSKFTPVIYIIKLYRAYKLSFHIFAEFKEILKLVYRDFFLFKNSCRIFDASNQMALSGYRSSVQCRLLAEGRQTRSRVILAKPQEGGALCPSDVIETRPCVGGYCPTYSWHTSYWSSDSRYVWCQRSDGLIVHGKHRQICLLTYLSIY